jgi:hypothetical protein
MVVRCRGSHIFYTEDGVVSLTRRPLFTSRKILVLISVKGSVDPRAKVRQEGLGKLKNPVTSSGIDPATLWLVA